VGGWRRRQQQLAATWAALHVGPEHQVAERAAEHEAQ